MPVFRKEGEDQASLWYQTHLLLFAEPWLEMFHFHPLEGPHSVNGCSFGATRDVSAMPSLLTNDLPPHIIV